MTGSALGLFLCRGCRLHLMLRPACLLLADQLVLTRSLSKPGFGRRGLPLCRGPATRRFALTETGLAPAGSSQRDDGLPIGCPSGPPSSSRRTMPEAYRLFRRENFASFRFASLPRREIFASFALRVITSTRKFRVLRASRHYLDAKISRSSRFASLPRRESFASFALRAQGEATSWPHAAAMSEPPE